LFLLIKSLQPEEKRQFHLFTSKYLRNKGNNYLKLFETIDRMDRYDEDLIREKYKNAVFLKQLHVTKNYLYNLILQSLTLPHLGSASEGPLGEILIHAEILYKKSLYASCLKLVEKGKDLARKKEKPLMLLEFYTLEQRIAIKRHSPEMFRELSVKGYYEMLQAQEEIRNFIELRRLLNSLIVIMEKPFEMLSDETRVKLYEESNHPLLRTEASALMTDAKIMYFNYWRQFYDYTHDYKKALEIAQKYVEFFRTESLAGKTDIFQGALFSHTNLFQAQLKCRKFDMAEDTLQMISEIPSHTADQKLNKAERVNLLRLNLLMEKGAFDQALEYASETEDFLKRYEEKISRKYRFEILSSLSTLHFYCGNYHKSLQHRNALLNHNEKEIPDEILELSMLHEAVLHYHLGNLDLIPYKIKALRRFFKKRKDYTALETELIKLISALSSRRKKEASPLFSNALPTFKKLKQQKINLPYFDNFDFISWLEASGKGITVSELTKNK
jgi:hypothetical protein